MITTPTPTSQLILNDQPPAKLLNGMTYQEARDAIRTCYGDVAPTTSSDEVRNIHAPQSTS